MGGEGYIPISEIKAFCDMYGIEDVDDRADFFSAIRAMDQAYLEHRAKEREAKDEKQKPADA